MGEEMPHFRNGVDTKGALSLQDRHRPGVLRHPGRCRRGGRRGKRRIAMRHEAEAPAHLLEVEGVRKEFPGVAALDDVQLRAPPGSVHALMGENGAGKSTLMKIIAGVYVLDRGEARFRGKPLNICGHVDALECGIAMIHQELSLMSLMTVAENVWIRREPTNRFGLTDHARMRRMTQDLFTRLNLPVDPDAVVGRLAAAQRQMIEIARAVSYDPDVLIMEEPTSSLTEAEVGRRITDMFPEPDR
ncbi:MAG: ATP-binding cassette domain-containing protein [Paracoccus sp. (in: a-proteobacteria)]